MDILIRTVDQLQDAVHCPASGRACQAQGLESQIDDRENRRSGADHGAAAMCD